MSITALEKALHEAQFSTCVYCGTKVHALQNMNGWQCCEKKLVEYYRSGFTVTPNPEIKNLGAL